MNELPTRLTNIKWLGKNSQGEDIRNVKCYLQVTN